MTRRAMLAAATLWALPPAIVAAAPLELVGAAKSVSRSAAAYEAGDLVTWMLPGNLPHIGIVSDRKASTGVPLVIHNIGHYRYRVN